MNKQFIFLWALVFGFLLSSCGNDDDLNEQQELVKILSFEFLASNNDDLQKDVMALIDEKNKIITATLPPNTSVTSLLPTIKLSDGARVQPPEDFPENFTDPVTYRVFGNNFSDTEYTVIVTVEDSKESKISNFGFLLDENPGVNLRNNISGKIDGTTIAIEFLGGTDISALIPNITLSPGATITPDDTVKQNFTNPVEYTVTAQDGTTKTIYTITATFLKDDKRAIINFEFSNIGGSTYTAKIDENDIMLELPEGTDLSNLAPTIETSLNAGVSPGSGVVQDFSKILRYEVTAEDGSKQTYTVNVFIKNSPGSDRAVLTEFYKANLIGDNLFNYLNWDLDALTMNDWGGVDLISGRVSGLFTNINIKIYNLPVSIGKLSELKSLQIYSLGLRELPGEIGDLKKLTLLEINSSLETLPVEIGELTELFTLNLTGNALKTIPVEIKDLKDNLRSLYLKNNKLTEIPNELGELTKLSLLDLSENPVISIPKEVCALKDNGGNTEIILDANDICEE